MDGGNCAFIGGGLGPGRDWGETTGGMGVGEERRGRRVHEALWNMCREEFVKRTGCHHNSSLTTSRCHHMVKAWCWRFGTNKHTLWVLAK